MKNFDIVIVGSGIVGTTAALLLSQLSQFNIAILEANTISPQWQKKPYDHRVSALSLAAKNIFNKIGVWDDICQQRISPFQRMTVWDENSDGKISFDCRDMQVPALGFIVENSLMLSTLLNKIKHAANITLFANTALMDFKIANDQVVLDCQNDNKPFNIAANCLIGADGGQSQVRKIASIPLHQEDYQDQAIVAMVETEFAHQATAWQRFLSTGPLAFLPLAEKNISSIVWSMPTAQANKILSLSDQDFCEKLSHVFEKRLGKIVKTSKRWHFPLQRQHAKEYVRDKIALLGDAAHIIHPLAGQGLNLGLLDALCLTDVMHAAVEKNRQFASFATLRKYERLRKSDNSIMLSAVDGIKKLFVSEKAVLKTLRGKGLQWVDQSNFLKTIFAAHAGMNGSRV